MKKKFLTILLTFALCVPLLSGCAEIRNKIAYTVYPIQYLIQRLSKGGAQYQTIQKSDITVQSSEIDPDYEKILKDSKVFFHIGNLDPYYDIYEDAIKATGVEDYDLAPSNTIYSFARYTKDTGENAEGTDENAVYLEEPYYEGAAFASVNTLSKDLYLWIDPIGMLSMGKNIRDWLIKDDPDQEALYTDNWNALESELIDLDAQYQMLASNLQNNNESISFVSLTPSFGSWQKTYGIREYPLVLSRYGVLPNEEQIQLMEERIRADGVHYIASEPNVTEEMQKLLKRVAEDCDLEKVTLSNLSSLSEDQSASGKDYISIMYENLNTLTGMVESDSENN